MDERFTVWIHKETGRIVKVLNEVTYTGIEDSKGIVFRDLAAGQDQVLPRSDFQDHFMSVSTLTKEWRRNEQELTKAREELEEAAKQGYAPRDFTGRP